MDKGLPKSVSSLHKQQSRPRCSARRKATTALLAEVLGRAILATFQLRGPAGTLQLTLPRLRAVPAAAPPEALNARYLQLEGDHPGQGPSRLISHFEERPIDPKRVHDDVVCGYALATIGDRRALQLETYGSRDRKIPGKVSQSIQFDEAAARDLRLILERALPNL